ncbi:MAG: glycosyltransferase family 4 protein [Actinomycetota bacterium]|nr:glycosyltransferase family 4 protein [Actinomycetota bacterium]
MNRIGINLLWLVPGVVGGSETYTTRLLHGLAERSSELDYTLFALPQFASAHPELSRTFKTLYAPLRGRSKGARVVAGENSWLALQAARNHIDLMHHAGGTMPLIRVSRPVLTIHDLQYLFYPEYFTRPKLTFLQTVMPRSAESARLILTPSEFTRRTVIERLDIDPTLVRVVPHGISPIPSRGEASTEVRNRYDIAGPFFLYPAATYPHKNHLVLVNGFARLLKMHPDASLVLTGAKGWREWSTAKSMESRLAEEIRTLKIQDRVKRLGYVSGADLDALYREACALVFPSRFEGFGAPILEAWARDCPVIAADATALPEVVADCGRLVSPDNAEDWAAAMSEMIEDDAQREQYIKSGATRAREFSWLRSADVLENAYAHALETTL